MIIVSASCIVELKFFGGLPLKILPLRREGSHHSCDDDDDDDETGT